MLASMIYIPQEFLPWRNSCLTILNIDKICLGTHLVTVNNFKTFALAKNGR